MAPISPFDNFRVDFDVEAFKAVLEQKGYRARWERWVPCPCVRTESAHPKIRCPVCYGRGDVFIDPLECRVEMTSLGQQKEFQNFSAWNIGSASLTVLDNNRFLNYRDRFTLLDSLSSHAEYRQRSSDVSSVTDFLQYFPVDMVYVTRMNDAETALITLVNGTDYTILSTGAIQWLSTANVPTPGAWYSLVYTYRPTYQVLELLNDVRDTYVKDRFSGTETFFRMPQRAMVKRSHLLFRTEQGQ